MGKNAGEDPFVDLENFTIDLTEEDLSGEEDLSERAVEELFVDLENFTVDLANEDLSGLEDGVTAPSARKPTRRRETGSPGDQIPGEPPVPSPEGATDEGLTGPGDRNSSALREVQTGMEEWPDIWSSSGSGPSTPVARHRRGPISWLRRRLRQRRLRRIYPWWFAKGR